MLTKHEISKQYLISKDHLRLIFSFESFAELLKMSEKNRSIKFLPEENIPLFEIKLQHFKNGRYWRKEIER